MLPIPTALIVDADPGTCQRYSRMLTDAVTVIDMAYDGREALAKALARPPALVITHADLPFFDGYTLCQILRDDRSTAAASIIITTHDVDPPSEQRARRAGADALLKEPVVAGDLLATVLRVLEASQTLRTRSVSASALAATRVTSMQDRLRRPHDKGRPRLRLSKVRDHDRRKTTTPTVAPPTIQCPTCGALLRHTHSYVGGVSATFSEQWDYFDCSKGCGTFQYRLRTKKLRRINE
jgi:DNA-binding response OmpR family regulator